MFKITKNLEILLIFLTFLGVCNSANILVWSAMSTHSIRLSMTPFMEGLAAAGHNVTFLCPFEDFENASNNSKINTYVPKKLKEVMSSLWDSEANGDQVNEAERKSYYKFILAWWDMTYLGELACKALHSDPEFIEWLRQGKDNWDLVIVEFFFNECAFGAVDYFKSKLAIYTTTTVCPDYMEAHGIPDEGASVPGIMFGFAPTELGFWKRFANTITPLLYSFTKEYFYLPKLEEISKPTYKTLGVSEDKLVSFREVERNASLIFINTHYSMEYARSFPPNVIPVGGNVVTKKKKPLPDEMKDFLDGAKEGFIYISFGSVYDFTGFDSEIQKEFINALYKFPNVKFLWKSGKTIQAELPKNVMVTKWAPQQTVLDHPNIKSFITHNGMGGTTESIHFAVPLISFPIVSEQEHNANAVASKGAGIKMELIGLKSEDLEFAISEMLHNEKYKKNMKKLSDIFKDRPSPTIDNAVWWVNHILRHDDINDYIIPPGLRQPWWMRRQIDIWLVAVALSGTILLIPLYISFAILKKLLK